MGGWVGGVLSLCKEEGGEGLACGNEKQSQTGKRRRCGLTPQRRNSAREIDRTADFGVHKLVTAFASEKVTRRRTTWRTIWRNSDN